MTIDKNKNLIIGETSQLSYYYDKDVVRISARQPISEYIYSQYWEKVYIFFAEQRTSLANKKEYKDLFYKINFDLTLEIVNKIKAKKIIFLSTSELWNLLEGPISVATPWNYKENYYTDSKRKITNLLMQNEKVTVFFPFNYNSIYRKESFLFHKIFDGIINKKKIKVGNLNIERELLHAKFVCREIEKKNSHDLIGCGKPVNIKQFICELYNRNGLNYNDLVIEENSYTDEKKPFYSSKLVPYTTEERIREYTDDIQNSLSKGYN